MAGWDSAWILLCLFSMVAKPVHPSQGVPGWHQPAAGWGKALLLTAGIKCIKVHDAATARTSAITHLSLFNCQQASFCSAEHNYFLLSISCTNRHRFYFTWFRILQCFLDFIHQEAHHKLTRSTSPQQVLLPPTAAAQHSSATRQDSWRQSKTWQIHGARCRNCLLHSSGTASISCRKAFQKNDRTDRGQTMW